MLEDIIEHNKRFVAEGRYKKYVSTKYPDRKLAIVTCMDTRLVELLEDALGLQHGDTKIIKNAGGVITSPYDSVMRSILIAVYELGVEKVAVIGHTNCGVQGMDPDEMMQHMYKRGISKETVDLLENYSNKDLRKWLTGFEDTEQAIRDSARLVRNHPLLPAGIEVGAYMIDTVTGELTKLD